MLRITLCSLALASAAFMVSLVTTLTSAQAAGVPAPRATASPSAVGAAPLRRLTRLEYTNTVRDLLGPVAVDADSFPEEGGSGFDNNADLAVATRIHAQKYMSTAEAVAAQAVADLPRLMRCQPTPANEASCLRRFIARFATRAWRATATCTAVSTRRTPSPGA